MVPSSAACWAGKRGKAQLRSAFLRNRDNTISNHISTRQEWQRRLRLRARLHAIAKSFRLSPIGESADHRAPYFLAHSFPANTHRK